MEQIDLDLLAAFLTTLSLEELQLLFSDLLVDVTALGFNVTIPEIPTVEYTIFLAQLLAKHQ